MYALFDPLKKLTSILAVVLTLSLTATTAAQQAKAGVEKLYILNCGEGVVGDISRWSPGVNVGKSMDFVDNCYLIRHTQVGFYGIPASPMPLQPCPRGKRRPIRG